uniref:Uncharacterized 9.4 kDa protein in trpG-ccsA intergenic region n=1 Tax=Cyanophora paradoxa TaxID=2762 RepID=YCXB_CYAPA|nr:hypothetical protein CypaCp129 [Cyanophora paradoxa]P48332.1 RecName: Full=Uncharacterized 9.4 kDa protein in trpG-ccsA intergenic region; AltName: Full=ORF77 [Cyanophora paradoxa]AAA81297.1 orf77 [Cyanophora paradoxa]
MEFENQKFLVILITPMVLVLALDDFYVEEEFVINDKKLLRLVIEHIKEKGQIQKRKTQMPLIIHNTRYVLRHIKKYT